jgi:hypothetical protein
VIISHSRCFVFLHIHKTAGESVTTALRPVLAPDDLVLRGRETASANGTVLNKHSTAGEVRAMLQTETWDRYFTFAFVRHPIDRTLSLYRWAAQRASPPRLTVAQRLRLRPGADHPDRSHVPEVRAYRETSTISEFIHHPLVEQTRSMQPQSASLCDEEGSLLVDYVGRFERLGEDLTDIAVRLGLPPVSLPWHNASQGPNLLFERQNVPRRRRIERDELSLDDRAYLTARFDDDFRRFGYEP